MLVSCATEINLFAPIYHRAHSEVAPQDVYPRLRSWERGSRRQQPAPSALSAANLPWPLGSLVAIGRLSLVAIKLSLVAMNRQFTFCRLCCHTVLVESSLRTFSR